MPVTIGCTTCETPSTPSNSHRSRTPKTGRTGTVPRIPWSTSLRSSGSRTWPLALGRLTPRLAATRRGVRLCADSQHRPHFRTPESCFFSKQRGESASSEQSQLCFLCCLRIFESWIGAKHLRSTCVQASLVRSYHSVRQRQRRHPTIPLDSIMNRSE